MRVLLVADDCNPQWPSLPVVGYQMCRSIAAIHDAVVVTQVRNKPNIDQAGMRSGQTKVEYVDNEYVAAPFHRIAQVLRGGANKAWTLNVALSYPSILAFEWEVWKRFRKDLKAGRFDLVHRITPMSPTLPSLLASRCPVPYVLGPLNGGLSWPAEYYGELRREREFMTFLRGASRFLPYYRRTFTRPSAILAAFQHTINDLPTSAHNRTIQFPEVGFDPATFFPGPDRLPSEKVNFLFVGRLVPYKCADVLIEAFALNPVLRKHRLWIVGDGPERPALEQLIEKHQLQDCVELFGWKTQTEVGEFLRKADVFAFPSIRELGAGVIVEAMACGLTCLAVDYGGPGGLIQERVGVRVKLQSKVAMIRDFADRMAELATQPDRTRAMGRAAAAYAATEYSWDSRAKKLLDVYRWAVEKTGPIPRPY